LGVSDNSGDAVRKMFTEAEKKNCVIKILIVGKLILASERLQYFVLK
jgi:hypothetical protein